MRFQFNAVNLRLGKIDKAQLEDEVKPLVERFLQERGLTLSPDKTHVTHITEGFDFLGQNIRKYNEKLLIKPSKGSIKRLLKKVRDLGLPRSHERL